MKVSRAMWILAALIFITSPAHADGTTTMRFTGVNGANNGVYYVSPYTGAMNYFLQTSRFRLSGSTAMTLQEGTE